MYFIFKETNPHTKKDPYDFDIEDIDNSEYTPPTPTIEHHCIEPTLFNKALNNATVEINDGKIIIKVKLNDFKKSIKKDTASLSVLHSSNTAKEFYKQGDIEELQLIEDLIQTFIKTKNTHINIID